MEHGDCDAVLLLLDRVADERMWIGTEPGYDRARYRRNWEAWLRDPRFCLLVALDGDCVVGNIDVVPDADGFEIAIIVAPEYRGRGIGSALMSAAIDWARAHGIRTLYLNVFPHNARARALYQRLGFVEIETQLARLRRQNGEAWDVIRMRKLL